MTERELRELIRMFTADWPEVERAEALRVALADPEAALICWRALAANAERQPAMHPTLKPSAE
jgi:hypothetical protein